MKGKTSSGAARRQTGRTLGLAAFEKISAVEGIHLTAEMRRDLEDLDRQDLSPAARSRWILGKYGDGRI